MERGVEDDVHLSRLLAAGGVSFLHAAPEAGAGDGKEYRCIVPVE
jgi:hypothetical protein